MDSFSLTFYKAINYGANDTASFGWKHIYEVLIQFFVLYGKYFSQLI